MFNGTNICQYMDTFWRNANYPYPVMQTPETWQKQRDLLKNIMEVSAPLTPLENELLTACVCLSEIGWQTHGAPEKPRMERYHLSGQAMRQGSNEFGLRVYPPQFVEVIAQIIENLGDPGLESLSDEFLAIENAGKLRPRYVAALLQLSELLLTRAKRGFPMPDLTQIQVDREYHARLLLAPYIPLIEVSGDRINYYLQLSEHDKDIEGEIVAAIFDPVHRWLNAYAVPFEVKLTPVEYQRRFDPTVPDMTPSLRKFVIAVVPTPLITRNNKEPQIPGMISLPKTPIRFALYIDAAGGRRGDSIVCKSSEDDHSIQVDAAHKALLDHLANDYRDNTNTARNDMDALGAFIYKLLFPSEIHNCFERTIDRAETDGVVEIHLNMRSDQFARLPWELAKHKELGFLGVSERVRFVRDIDTSLSSTPASSGSGHKLKLLVALSSPPKQSPIGDEQEWRSFFEGLPNVEPIFTPSTIEAINDALTTHKPQIFQFVGHGNYEDQDKLGSLLFENASLWGDSVEEGRLAALLGGSSVQFVALSACDSAVSNSPKSYKGIVPTLISRGIQAVVGMQYPIRVKTARRFFEAFYRHFTKGESLDTSVQLARRYLHLTLGDDPRACIIPTIYQRGNGELPRNPLL